tara:strand:- start:478 stop:699 length:222 start_codon:yes stop_codon:yes gene_type:complete
MLKLTYEGDPTDSHVLAKNLESELAAFNLFLMEELGMQPMANFEKAMLHTYLFHKVKGAIQETAPQVDSSDPP